MKIFKIIIHLVIISFLTILTQVGGVIWIIVFLISSFFKIKKRLVFPVIYLVFNVLIIPPIANYYGRVKLPVFNDNLKPRNIFYPLLFRNYVTVDLKYSLTNASSKLKKDNIIISYLDANFPFKNGYPLFPHLSHNDGKKIDINFMYLTNKNKPTYKKPSISGYGVYAEPIHYKGTQTERCRQKGYWLYDKSHYLTLGTINNLKLDKIKTRLLIKTLLNDPTTSKILLEPHLKQTLNLNSYSKIRFHGCRAVRHDDHLHLETK